MASEPPDPLSHERELVRLGNGLRVLLVQRPHLEGAAIVCIVGAGSRCDPPHAPGLAHVVEHLLFRCPEDSAQAVALRTIFQRGGDVNGTTGISWTTFFAAAHHWDLELALEGLAAVVCQLHVDAAALQLEKAIVEQELLLVGESRKEDVENVKFRSLYANPELQHSPQGTIKALRRIEAADARAFYNGWYRGGNMVLCVVGRFDQEALLERIRALFGRLKPGKPEPPRASRTRERQRTIVRKVRAPLSLVALAFPGLRYTPSEAAYAGLVASIFCQGTQSRLFHALREETGWAYYVDGGIDYGGDFGTLDVVATTRPANARKMMARILHEAETLATAGIPGEEFEAAKERCVRWTRLLADDPVSTASWYAYEELLAPGEDPNVLLTRVEAYRSACLEEGNRLAASILSPARCLVYVVGPLGIWSRVLVRWKARSFARRAARRERETGLQSEARQGQ